MLTGEVREDTHFLAEELGVDNNKEPATENDQRIEYSANDGAQHNYYTGNVPGAYERIKNGNRFEKEKSIEPIEQNATLECFLQMLPTNYI